MINISVDKEKIRKLSSLLENNAKKIKKELAVAVNETAKMTKSKIAKLIAIDMNLPQREIKKGIIGKRATAAMPQTEVILKKGWRYSLKQFKPEQKAGGVRVKIRKSGKSILVPQAFMGPKPGMPLARFGGHVFKRVGKTWDKGKRLPIILLRGPSAWGAFTKNNHLAPTVEETKKRFAYEIDRRIRKIELELEGKI
jgi:hypothetical protein